MSKALLTAIAVSVVLISILTSVSIRLVRADVDSINFIDSDLTVYSPLNMTYNHRNLDLLVTVPIKSPLSEEGSVSLNYSVDGVYNGSVTLHDVDASPSPLSHVAWVALGTGSESLPELPDGSHCLVLYLYGINMQNYQPIFKSYVETVYFSLYDPNSVFIPTPSPTPIPTTSVSAAHPSLTPIPSPSIIPTSTPSPTCSSSTPSETTQLTLQLTPGLAATTPIENTVNVDFGIVAAVIVVVLSLAIAGLMLCRRKAS